MAKGRKREVKTSALTVGVTLRGKYISSISVGVVYGDVIICHWNQHC